MKNDRLLKTISREPVDATPIWIMRQAGRYLPEYRATRAKAGSFMVLCKTPELACEVTLQPLRRYDLDASIIFSDILTIPDAMGLGLTFIEGQGPIFAHPLENPSDILRLHVPDKQDLNYVYDAIRLVQHDLAGKIPLIGFCGSPWTLAVYMIEGRSRPGFPKARKLMEEDASLMHHLLDILAKSVCLHLNGQIEAGADVVMIFDTWGGMLTTEQYEQFSLYYVKQCIAGLRLNDNNKKIPVILFTKGGHRWLEQMADSGCDAIGVDWEISLKEARSRIGNKIALQGNLNPTCLLQTPEIIQQETAKVLESFGHGSGHVFNLGHGITPEVPPEHVAVLVDTVHELSKSYHLQNNKI
jgi:uroporphyrinogen decarboxylase